MLAGAVKFLTQHPHYLSCILDLDVQLDHVAKGRRSSTAALVRLQFAAL